MLTLALDNMLPLLCLGLLGFALVTATLGILAAQRRHAIEIHERVRRSKELRQAYLKAKGQGK